MVFARAAIERAMTMQAVILRVLSGSLTWLQAADILGIHPRSLRRWRARYQADRVYGLFDRRHRPSWRRAPLGDIERIVREGLMIPFVVGARRRVRFRVTDALALFDRHIQVQTAPRKKRQGSPAPAPRQL